MPENATRDDLRPSGAAPGAVEPQPSEDPGDTWPSTGLLSFYDRLRERIVVAVERRGGRLGQGTVEVLLLVPDLFVLLVRLSIDPAVPKATRATIGGALAYFILPVDLLPEALVGGAGFVDDLVLGVAVLSQVLSRDLEPYAERYWSGSKQLRVVLSDVMEAADGLLGQSLYGRLKGVLRRRGIEVADDAGRPEVPSPS